MSAWVLVGSPNSGKTTLYNWLTGAKFKTVNYPGATVEYSVGGLREPLREVHNGFNPVVIDTPGIYSLQAQSEDEKVTFSTLFEKKANQNEISGIIFVIDGTQLARHLALAEHLKETGYPIVYAVTMADLLRTNKMEIDLILLQKELGSSVVLFDGLLGAGLNDIIICMQKYSDQHVVPIVPHWDLEKQSRLIKKGHTVAEAVIKHGKKNHTLTERTKKIDQVLLHPFFGLVFFFIFMTLLFASIYWMAQPVMDLIDSGFGFTGDKVTELIPGLVGNFIGKGLITAIGGVVVFIPQIFILFLGIGLLESTGYLARVAALIDKPLSLVGLGGRSFVPLLSGFACAIPAIMATRNISSRKERLIAQSVIPFMTCSARLPVYALLIGFLFGGGQALTAGLILAVLYFSSLIVGAIASGVLSKIIEARERPSLMMELPLYRQPRFRVLVVQALHKSKSFLKKAGPIILGLAILLWFATNFPRPSDGQNLTRSEIAQNSYAAKAGRQIEPLFTPLGVDWRVGFGLISAFAAREVFVSALALVFNVEGEGEAQTEGLLKSMREATFVDGTKIFTVASVVGLFIFFTIALQCISTFSILRRETGSWTPAVLQLVLSNLAAYGLAATAVQSLKHFGY